MVNNPTTVKVKGPGQRPESIEVKEVCPSKSLSSTLMENEFYAPVSDKAQLISKDVPLYCVGLWLRSHQFRTRWEFYSDLDGEGHGARLLLDE